MALRRLIHDHLVLITGILLPILLVLLFLAASTLPRILAEPPAYDFLFYTDSRRNAPGTPVTLGLRVEDNGKLAAIVTVYQPGSHGTLPYPVVYRYSAKQHIAQPIRPAYFREVLLTEQGRLQDEKTLKLPDFLARLTLDSSLVAPDGYIFDTSRRYRRSGLAGEIFSIGGRSPQGFRLTKGNVSFPFDILAPDGGMYYDRHNINFLGWVIDENGSEDRP